MTLLIASALLWFVGVGAGLLLERYALSPRHRPPRRLPPGAVRCLICEGRGQVRCNLCDGAGYYREIPPGQGPL